MGKIVASIVRADESGIETAALRAIELAGGLKPLMTPDSKVLIRLRLCRPESSVTGCVTDSPVAKAVADLDFAGRKTQQ